MAKINIYMNEQLKARVDRAHHFMNISEVCCVALEKELARAEKKMNRFLDEELTRRQEPGEDMG